MRLASRTQAAELQVTSWPVPASRFIFSREERHDSRSGIRRAARRGWQRPTLPPEGEKGFLDEHPFDLHALPCPTSVLVEQVTIPMRDGITLAGTLFRPREESEPVPVVTSATPYGKDITTSGTTSRTRPPGTFPAAGSTWEA